MKNKKIFGISIPIFMLLVAIATAGTFIISGIVIANIQIVKVADYGQMKIFQDTTKKIAQVNSLITDSFNFSFSCNNPSIFIATLNYPIGSTISVQTANLQGNNIISPNISVGDITLAIRAMKQGFFNCTIDVQNSTLLNVSFVDSFG